MFNYLCFSYDRNEILSLEKLEAQLKACLCRITFSLAKVSSTDGFDVSAFCCAPTLPNICACVHPAVCPRLGPHDAGDRSRPFGGHAGDSLSHPKTFEGNISSFYTTAY